MNILIIGASGGIGLSIVKSAIKHYPNASILATYHHHIGFSHSNVHWIKLDVTNENEIKQLSKTVHAVDILINAVGFLHSEQHKPEKSIAQFSHDLFDKNMSLNTLPSLMLAKHFEAALKASTNNTFYVVLSARIGSIKDNNIGGWLSYRMSKAALNMAIKTISIEWRLKLPHCCVMLFHPGTTDTELSKPFQKNLPKNQLQSPEFTSESLLTLIHHSTPSDSGRFRSFDGTDIEW